MFETLFFSQDVETGIFKFATAIHNRSRDFCLARRIEPPGLRTSLFSLHRVRRGTLRSMRRRKSRAACDPRPSAAPATTTDGTHPVPFSVSQPTPEHATLRHMKVEEIAEAIAKLPPDQFAPLPPLVHRIRGGPHRPRRGSSTPRRPNLAASPVVRLLNSKSVRRNREQNPARMVSPVKPIWPHSYDLGHQIRLKN